MKKLSLLLASACLALFCAVGCEEPEPDPVKPEVSVNVESLEFAWDGGSQTIEVKANQAWEITGPSWVSFEPNKGEGNAKVTVTASPSTRFDDGEKVETISIRCGTVYASVKVHRESKPISERSTLYLYEDGGVRVVNRAINFDGSTSSYINTYSNAVPHLEILEGADWIIPIFYDTKVNNYFDSYNLSFKVLPNNTREPRHAKIAIQTEPATDAPDIVEFDQAAGTLRADLLEIAKALNMDQWGDSYKWKEDEITLSWSGVYLDDNYEIETLSFYGTGVQGNFPEQICNLKSLKKILFMEEFGLTGTIPESIKNLTNLEEFLIYGGNMEGTLPDVFDNMPNLKDISLTMNHFSGPLPASLGSCTKLEEIRIIGNEFTGTIPESWCNTDKLIKVEGNHLSGQFPDAFYKMPSATENFYYSYAQSDGYKIDVSNAPKIRKYIEKETLEDLWGKTFSVPDIIKSNKYTVFINWGTWCPFSAELMPALNDYYKKYHSQGLEYIAYSAYDQNGENNVRKVAREQGYDKWYNIADCNGISYPTSVPNAEIVDSEGNILFTWRIAYDPNYDRFNRSATFELLAFLEELMGPLEEADYYESKDYSKDGKVIQLQKATVGKGINLVIMGDGYTDKDMSDGGVYDDLMWDTMNAFFEVEPYASFRDRFNVYAVKVVSKNGKVGDGYVTALNSQIDKTSAYISCDYDKCFEYALKVPSITSRKDLTVIVMANSTRSCGTTSTWYDDCSSVAIQSSHNNEPAVFASTVQHEAGGHGFAFLGDEYDKAYGERPSAAQIERWKKQCEEKGWYANVDFTDDPSKVKWSRFLNDDRYKNVVGIFEGGMGYTKGVYRPSEQSTMREDWGGFNAPSREAIYKRIMELSGEGYSWDAFVTYDAVNRK